MKTMNSHAIKEKRKLLNILLPLEGRGEKLLYKLCSSRGFPSFMVCCVGVANDGGVDALKILRVLYSSHTSVTKLNSRGAVLELENDKLDATN